MTARTVPIGRLTRADRIFRAAVKSGRLIPPSLCPECGKKPRRRAVNGHHRDHRKPLEVEWVCTPCHGKLSQRVLMLGDVPQSIRIAAVAKAKREGVSLRALTLRLWKQWTENP